MKKGKKSQGLRYDECYAKIVLSQLVSNAYENIVIKDKPDLQFSDGSRGIEVTQAIEEKQQEAEKLFVKASRGLVNDKERVMKRIREIGCKCENGILLGIPSKDTFQLILKAMEDKLDKINNGSYAHFCHYDLFIFSDVYADDMMQNNALEEMIKLSENFELVFEKIFVLVPGYLYIFELRMKQICVIEYSNELQYEIACQANKMRG